MITHLGGRIEMDEGDKKEQK